MHNSQSIHPGKISWAGNAAKREADITLYRAMAYDLLKQASLGRPLRILSFPAQTWAWELGLKDFYASTPMEFIGLERDPTLHRKAKRFAAGFPKAFKMTDKPVSFREFSQTSRMRRPCDLVYLDWMGTWSSEKKEDLSALFQRGLLAVGGLLVMTVSLRRGQPETLDELADLSYDLPLAFYDARGEDKYTGNIKVRGIPHWVANHAMNNHEVKMRPLLASVYYSRTGVSEQTQPQLQIMMLREA